MRDLLSVDLKIPSVLPEPTTASCYLWTAPTNWLTPVLWSFQTFLDERLHRWVEGNPEEDEKDRALERDAEEAQGGLAD